MSVRFFPRMTEVPGSRWGRLEAAHSGPQESALGRAARLLSGLDGCAQGPRGCHRAPFQSGLRYRKWQQPAPFLGKFPIPRVQSILTMGCYSKQLSATRALFSCRGVNREGSVLANSSQGLLPPLYPAPATPWPSAAMRTACQSQRTCSSFQNPCSHNYRTFPP